MATLNLSLLSGEMSHILQQAVLVAQQANKKFLGSEAILVSLLQANQTSASQVLDDTLGMQSRSRSLLLNQSQLAVSARNDRPGNLDVAFPANQHMQLGREAVIGLDEALSIAQTLGVAAINADHMLLALCNPALSTAHLLHQHGVTWETTQRIVYARYAVTPPQVTTLHPGHQIFISYKRMDWARYVVPLLEQLHAAGLTYWVDQHLIEGGKDWMDEINAALEACDSMILCVSPEAITSKHVKMEYRYFFNNDKPIYPLILRPTKLPAELQTIQYFDYTELSKLIHLLAVQSTR
ncbi:MAG: TIR domain-containing protein [Anaerolineales bacterium]